MNKMYITHHGGFVHYEPPKFEDVREADSIEESDAAMEELIRSEEERKRRPDDNSSTFWS